MEVPRSTPTAGVYLELGILPIGYEIEIRQLLFLRKILMKDVNDPVLKIYCEMLKYPYERNWANAFLTYVTSITFLCVMIISLI